MVKIGGKLVAELPQPLVEKLGLKEGDELQLEEQEGWWLLTKAEPEKPAQPAVSAEELALLRKLNSFRFDARTPEKVDRLLSASEKRALEGLIKKRHVRLYKGGKYQKTGVYSISESVYGLLKQRAVMTTPAESTPMAALQVHGWLVIANENEAVRLSEALRVQIQAGEVFGMRGFDTKFYVVTRRFYDDTAPRIAAVLEKGPADREEIAAKLRLPVEATTAVIEPMRERSELIEKAKGMYELIR